MGARVTQSGSEDIARARQLKKVLESGAPPVFVPAGLISNQISNQARDQQPTFSPNSAASTLIRSQFLEPLFQASPDALCISDCEHRVVWANCAFSQMFGYEPNAMLGHPLENLVVPAERMAEALWLRESTAKGQSVTLETQRRKQDGTLIDVAVSGAPLVVDGKTIGYYAGYHDISERKRAEALSSALYRVAEQSSAAQDLQQFFTVVHSIVDELMYAKNFYIALYDPVSETLSFPYFVDEQDSPPPSKKLGHGLTEFLLRTGEPLLATPEVLQAMEDRGEVARSGSRSLDWMGVPLKVGNHTFGALVVQTYSKNIRYLDRDKEILTFVSQQIASAIEIKKNEQALRRSEARYRSLVQSSVYGIYRSSLAGQFLDVNAALIGMLGYKSLQEVLLLDPLQQIFANPGEHARLMDEFHRTGRIDGLEVKWQKQDGSIITVRISGRAVSSVDEPADVIEAIAEDVTDRRALEDQFRQAQKMEAVGRLAGGVAHDFNNLLMVVSGYTEVILAKLDFDHPLHEKARAIQQAADRATTLTRQLLAFSRKQMLELKVVDINTIVQDMQRLLQPLIGENVELVTHLSPDAGHTRADAGQIEQVLMNLVVNAKDAMPAGGKLTIQTQSITLDESHRGGPTFIRPGHYVMLSVIDTGLGMDKETQSRIFEPFFTTKEKGKGTGLGLSTVYGIVKQTGGYVMVQSEEGRGTAFNIYLPRVNAAAELVPAPSPRAAEGGTETILLVEDEDSVRQLVRETLQARGYRVVEAENGAAGLSAASLHTGVIDLIITDVVMPGMSGHELAQQLAQSRPETKVLYLSGYTEDAITTEGTLEGGKAFLQKPFTLQNLSRKVREVLEA